MPRARDASKACRTIPGLLDFAVDERSRNILGLLGSGPDIGRSIVAEPGIPPDRAAALRKAFMETMEDPEFVAEMRKRNLDIEPLSGEEVQRIVAASVATPKELVDQAKRYAGVAAVDRTNRRETFDAPSNSGCPWQPFFT